MTHDHHDDPVDVGQMIAWIADGETAVGDQKIGTEHEKFLFYRHNLAPVAYEGDAGIGALLDRLLTELGPGADHGTGQHHRHHRFRWRCGVA